MSAQTMHAMLEPQNALQVLKGLLSESFEIPAERVVPSANLFTDLDLDSIDAVDLAIKLQEMTGKRIKAESFKSVRTVQDLIETIHQLLTADAT